MTKKYDIINKDKDGDSPTDIIVSAQPMTIEYYAMKILAKSEIVRLKQIEHINSEKNILSKIYHPFIVNLYIQFNSIFIEFVHFKIIRIFSCC